MWCAGSRSGAAGGRGEGTEQFEREEPIRCEVRAFRHATYALLGDIRQNIQALVAANERELEILHVRRSALSSVTVETVGWRLSSPGYVSGRSYDDHEASGRPLPASRREAGLVLVLRRPQVHGRQGLRLLRCQVWVNPEGHSRFVRAGWAAHARGTSAGPLDRLSLGRSFPRAGAEASGRSPLLYRRRLCAGAPQEGMQARVAFPRRSGR